MRREKNATEREKKCDGENNATEKNATVKKIGIKVAHMEHHVGGCGDTNFYH